MFTGTVKNFNMQRGFGFIKPDDGSKLPADSGPDVFVHITAVQRADLDFLEPGDRVDFDIVQGSRAGQFKAVNLRLLADDAPAPAVRYGA